MRSAHSTRKVQGMGMDGTSGRTGLSAHCRLPAGSSCTAFEITGCRGPPIDSLRFSIRCGSDAPQMFVGSKDAPRVPCRRLPLAFASISASALDPAPSGPATDTSEPLLQSALQLWLQVRSCCHACQRMGLAFAGRLAHTHMEASVSAMCGRRSVSLTTGMCPPPGATSQDPHAETPCHSSSAS